MPRARANGIEIEYETFGRPEDPALLLVMGLGAQMILWHEEFCEALASRGRHVVRFDNRDVGRSTWFDAAGTPDLMATMAAAAKRQPVSSAYRLRDMAADAAGLLDALGIDSAHVVGASMGGMIAQTLAIEHPARVRTLTSIMSTTGHPDLPAATPEAMAVLLTPAPTERDAAIERAVAVWRTIGSPGFPVDEDELRAQSARAFDRGVNPAGIARQLVAILASGSRRESLRAVQAPTLVIHGSADPLVPEAAGRDTAASVPGAELLLIDGMGHDLPRALWPRFVDAIAKLSERG
ncbi:alpha/beta hydrolase [Myxococcota bacterium]|nr:alpha/beta hydrolase [Myxococcota bacterium]MCZ7619793.1 alpha/beta fold hydrolase [Myxococcota bacterium]